jgi:hypothetical protein
MADNFATKIEKSQDRGTVGMEPLDAMVKAFLATRDLRANSRVDVVFDQASVEGCGKGVSCPQ